MVSRLLSEESVLLRFPLFILLVTIFTAGCTQEDSTGNIVARVNNQTLTLEMVRENSNGIDRLTNDDIRQIANRWITNELLYREAQQRGYDAAEHIQRKVLETKKQLCISELLENEVYSLAENSVRSDEIALYLQSHNSEFILHENLVKLSLVIFQSLESANQFREAALGDQGWNSTVSLFRQNSSNPIMSFRDSVFFTQSSLYPPELWKVANALGMLEVSFPVKTSVGFVVMRSLGQFKIGAPSPLQYVESEIRSRLTMELRQQRYQQFIQTLRNKYTVQLMISTQDSLTQLD
jgi:parvulin-like peptidyl-prolyl isomerase